MSDASRAIDMFAEAHATRVAAERAVGQLWRDIVHTRFEARRLQPLGSEEQAYRVELERLDAALDKVLSTLNG